MTDQPTNREIYAAIMDLRGRIEALAWDLTAIEERMDRFADRQENDAVHDVADEAPWSCSRES